MTGLQEHLDHEMGRASELQNALALSRMEASPDDWRIDALVQAGLFVVVEEHTTYCRRTDALMGSRRCLVAAYSQQEGADRRCRQEESDGESDFYVWPRTARPPPGETPVTQVTIRQTSVHHCEILDQNGKRIWVGRLGAGILWLRANGYRPESGDGEHEVWEKNI